MISRGGAPRPRRHGRRTRARTPDPGDVEPAEVDPAEPEQFDDPEPPEDPSELNVDELEDDDGWGEDEDY